MRLGFDTSTVSTMVEEVFLNSGGIISCVAFNNVQKDNTALFFGFFVRRSHFKAPVKTISLSQLVEIYILRIEYLGVLF